MTRLFVYGTLLRGEDNAVRMRQAQFVCATRTRPGFQLVDLGPYPGMLPRPNTTATGREQTSVAGEVYEVSDELLGELDTFEEHPLVYVRTVVWLQDGQACQTYLLRELYAQGAPVLDGGEWRHRPKLDVAHPRP